MAVRAQARTSAMQPSQRPTSRTSLHHRLFGMRRHSSSTRLRDALIKADGHAKRAPTSPESSWHSWEAEEAEEALALTPITLPLTKSEAILSLGWEHVGMRIVDVLAPDHQICRWLLSQHEGVEGTSSPEVPMSSPYRPGVGHRLPKLRRKPVPLLSAPSTPTTPKQSTRATPCTTRCPPPSPIDSRSQEASTFAAFLQAPPPPRPKKAPSRPDLRQLNRRYSVVGAGPRLRMRPPSLRPPPLGLPCGANPAAVRRGATNACSKTMKDAIEEDTDMLERNDGASGKNKCQTDAEADEWADGESDGNSSEDDMKEDDDRTPRAFLACGKEVRFVSPLTTPRATKSTFYAPSSPHPLALTAFEHDTLLEMPLTPPTIPLLRPTPIRPCPATPGRQRAISSLSLATPRAQDFASGGASSQSSCCSESGPGSSSGSSPEADDAASTRPSSVDDVMVRSSSFSISSGGAPQAKVQGELCKVSRFRSFSSSCSSVSSTPSDVDSLSCTTGAHRFSTGGRSVMGALHALVHHSGISGSSESQGAVATSYPIPDPVPGLVNGVKHSLTDLEMGDGGIDEPMRSPRRSSRAAKRRGQAGMLDVILHRHSAQQQHHQQQRQG